MLRRAALYVVLAIAVALPACVEAAVFADPTGLFQTFIPRDWVYQAQQSSRVLSVFYGPGAHNLVYFEILEHVSYETAEEYLDYILAKLEGPGGLDGFRREEGPDSTALDGRAGAHAVYSYTAKAGQRQQEYRLIALVGGGRAVSITVSDERGSFADTRDALQVVLDEWRWLF